MKRLTNYFLFIIITCTAAHSFANIANYNSNMLGDRAGGMGGAFTALSDDPAAAAYYNPASLARLDGSSLSTAISLFNKYDITYGGQEKLGDSIFRINKGSILSVPSASGIFTSFRNFTAGLSVVIPEYQAFGGDIFTSGDNTTFLRVNDQSLWIGGAFAFNLDEKRALGFTAYYTSRTFNKSSTNRYDTGSEIIVENEERTLTTNSIIYLLGYYQKLSDCISLGLSYRFRSLLIAGDGSYIQSTVGTTSGASPINRSTSLDATSKHPDQLSLGLAYEVPQKFTYSFDLKTYGENSYRDLSQYGDTIEQQNIYNFAVGYEKYLQPWLILRSGLFTDYASSPVVPLVPTRRYQDHVDKFGFSLNFGIRSTQHTMISLGGYYLGGEGWGAEKIGTGYRRIKKTDRLFSFLVGSSYNF